jgi:hypothetical protein
MIKILVYWRRKKTMTADVGFTGIPSYIYIVGTRGHIEKSIHPCKHY